MDGQGNVLHRVPPFASFYKVLTCNPFLSTKGLWAIPVGGVSTYAAGQKGTKSIVVLGNRLYVWCVKIAWVPTFFAIALRKQIEMPCDFIGGLLIPAWDFWRHEGEQTMGSGYCSSVTDQEVSLCPTKLLQKQLPLDSCPLYIQKYSELNTMPGWSAIFLMGTLFHLCVGHFRAYSAIILCIGHFEKLKKTK